MFTNILVPIDTSYVHDDWAKSSLKTAWELVQKSDGHVHIVSVVPDNLLKGFYPNLNTEEFVQKARDHQKSIVENNLPRDARVEYHVKEGGICAKILEAARELPADVIVMASHGPMAKDYFLGSNASHVALHAPCSVFIVREMKEAGKEKA
jgi:nucleotide-binding universal stress UspA family protein